LRNQQKPTPAIQGGRERRIQQWPRRRKGEKRVSKEPRGQRGQMGRQENGHQGPKWMTLGWI